MVFTQGPSAHLGSLATGHSLGTISRSSGITRFVQGGVVKTFRCATQSFGGSTRDFRLTGLQCQGSTPWMVAGFVVLLCIGFARDIGSILLNTYQEKEALMKAAKRKLTFLVYGILNLTWAIGASAMSVPLLA